MFETEDLFRSIDTIVQQRISKLPYDQTVQAMIVSNENASKNEYTVEYQSAKFIAYSENTDYEIGTQVYVQIPKADFKQKKTIISKIINDEETSVSAMPFDTYVKCTDNLCDSSLLETSIQANNGSINKVELYSISSSSKPIAGYGMMGVKIGLNVDLLETVISGNYYLDITLREFDQSKSSNNYQQSEYSNSHYYIEKSDLVTANLFNTYGYCNQEKTFDVTNKVISDINIYLCQENNFYDSNESRVANAGKISVNKIDLTFGYSKEDFPKSSKLVLYTRDGLQYVSTSTSRQLESRWLIREQDTTQLIANEQDLQSILNTMPSNIFKVNWYSFDNDNTSADGYELISSTDVSLKQELNVSQSIEKQIFKLEIYDNRDSNQITYEANKLEFINESYIQNSETLDLLTGLKVEFLKDECSGVYNIYGQNGKSLSSIQSYQTHYLIVQYSSKVSLGRTLSAGDILTWYIPMSNTMISNPVDGVTYDSANNDKCIVSDGMYKITRTLIKSDILDNGTYRLPYQIEDTYSQSKTNNTIRINLVLKEGQEVGATYETEKELIFGFSGSQGAEYNFSLQLVENTGDTVIKRQGFNIKSTKSLIIKPTLQSYDGTILTVPNTISYDFVVDNGDFEITNTNTLTLKDNLTLDNIGCNVLMASVNYSGQELKAYLPLSVYNGTYTDSANCPSIIVYDITGKKPNYYKSKCELSKENSDNSQLKNITWEIFIDNTLNSNFYPIINKTDSILYPLSTYYKDYDHFVLKAYLEDSTCCWVQPIYIIQSNYPLNQEITSVNDLAINGVTLLDTMVSNISKDSIENTSNGIFMGTILDNNNNNKNTGLYSYCNDNMVFRLDDTGFEINGTEDIKANISNVYVLDSYFEGDVTFVNSEGEKINLGSESKPVYIKDGKLVECGNLASNVLIDNQTIATVIANLTSRISTLEKKTITTTTTTTS